MRNKIDFDREIEMKATIEAMVNPVTFRERRKLSRVLDLRHLPPESIRTRNDDHNNDERMEAKHSREKKLLFYDRPSYVPCLYIGMYSLSQEREGRGRRSQSYVQEFFFSLLSFRIGVNKKKLIGFEISMSGQ